MTVLMNKLGQERGVTLTDAGDMKSRTCQLFEQCKYEDRRGRAALAHVTRVSDTQLARYRDREDLAAFIPIDIVVEAETLAGYPLITELLAQMQGFQLFKPAGLIGRHSVLRLLRLCLKESGELQQAVLEAVEDGKLDPEELHTIIKEARDTIQALQTLIHWCERELKGEVS